MDNHQFLKKIEDGKLKMLCCKWTHNFTLKIGKIWIWIQLSFPDHTQNKMGGSGSEWKHFRSATLQLSLYSTVSKHTSFFHLFSLYSIRGKTCPVYLLVLCRSCLSQRPAVFFSVSVYVSGCSRQNFISLGQKLPVWRVFN